MNEEVKPIITKEDYAKEVYQKRKAHFLDFHIYLNREKDKDIIEYLGSLPDRECAKAIREALRAKMSKDGIDEVVKVAEACKDEK